MTHDKYELTISMRDNADGGDHYFLTYQYDKLEAAKADFEAMKASHKLENMDQDSAYYSECHLELWDMETGELVEEYDEYINKIYKVKTGNGKWAIYAVALYNEKFIEEFEAEQEEDYYFIDEDYEEIFDFKYLDKQDDKYSEGLRTKYVIR